jgi:biopolymer transport protein ExbD
MKPRRRGRRRHAHIGRESDLNITAFLNLMVVLLPFLLTTAVFSRMAVVAVNVPTPSVQPLPDIPPPPPDPNRFTLALRLEEQAIVVRAGKATLPPVPRTPDGAYDTARLAEVLAGLKADHPEHDVADVYARPETPYRELIAVMDAVSFRPDGTALFTDVRLGEFSR